MIKKYILYCVGIYIYIFFFTKVFTCDTIDEQKYIRPTTPFTFYDIIIPAFISILIKNFFFK